MKKVLLSKLFVLAFCTLSNLLFSQQNSSSICRLGDIKNDSLLPFVENLSFNCSKEEELRAYLTKSLQLNKLKKIEIIGETSSAYWQSIFSKIKLEMFLKTIVFDDNAFESLPIGFENLFYVESMQFSNNDDIDYFQLVQQLKELKNLRTLQLDIYSVFDVPDSIVSIKNLSELILINKDEAISEQNIFENNTESIAYDFYFKKAENNTVHVKYISFAGAIDADEYKELSRRFSTTHNHPIVSQMYEPNYTFVNPPIKGIDVARKYYNINPSIENVLVYSSGTKIFIPANAFVDKEGNSITENVKIAYREFRDQVDILVSGIPMKYDSAGSVNDFESAGMFEMFASVGKDPVELAKGKNIDLNFASTSVDSTYNFYAYDDKTGNWEFQNRPKQVTVATKISPKIYSKAYLRYRYLLNSRPRIADSLTLKQRFESFNYLYTEKYDTNYKFNRFHYKSNSKNVSVPYYRSIKINNIKKLKDGTVLFKLKYNYFLHPELAAFSNVYFACSENIGVQDFRKKYAQGKTYNDIRIYNNGTTVELDFKEIKNITTMNASFGYIKDSKEFVEVKKISSYTKQYNKRLRSREKMFNKNIKKNGTKEYKTYEITDPEEIKQFAYKAVKSEMSEEEKRMTYEQWLSYYDQIVANELEVLFKSQATSENLMQSLRVSGMGIYNCDQIRRIDQPVEILASYKSNNQDKKIEAVSCFIIDKNKNSVFQYNGTYGYQPSNIVFSNSKNANNTLVVVNSNGNIAIYTNENFKENEFKNKEKFEFKVNEINSSFTSIEDLRKIVGL